MINQIKQLEVQVGDRITIYSVSDMAMTVRTEATVHEVFSEPEFRPSYVNQIPSYCGTWRFGIMKSKGKRKPHYLQFKPEVSLVIPGWGHPERDADAYHSFTMNACINIAASPDEIRGLVERNLNPLFTAHDRLLSAERPLTEGEYIMVYPDSPTEHAVIQGMRDELVRCCPPE